jgi:16S rRNA (guanine966-N2)-methyltransferase
VAALRENLLDLGLGQATRVKPGDVARVVSGFGRAKERFDLVLLDPPYASDEPTRALEALVDSGILAPGAMVVLERARRHPSPQPPGLLMLDERRYGDTVVARYVAGETE